MSVPSPTFYLSSKDSIENTLLLMSTKNANTTQELEKAEKELQQGNFEFKKDICFKAMIGSIALAAMALYISPPVSMSIAGVAFLSWNIKKMYEDTEKNLNQTKDIELDKISKIYNKAKRYLVELYPKVKISADSNYKKLLNDLCENYTPLPYFQEEMTKNPNDQIGFPAEQRRLKDILDSFKPHIT